MTTTPETKKRGFNVVAWTMIGLTAIALIATPLLRGIAAGAGA